MVKNPVKSRGDKTMTVKVFLSGIAESVSDTENEESKRITRHESNRKKEYKSNTKKSKRIREKNVKKKVKKKNVKKNKTRNQQM